MHRATSSACQQSKKMKNRISYIGESKSKNVGNLLSTGSRINQPRRLTKKLVDEHLVGTMIEIPGAARVGDKNTEAAELFSSGTNDLILIEGQSHRTRAFLFLDHDGCALWFVPSRSRHLCGKPTERRFPLTSIYSLGKWFRRTLGIRRSYSNAARFARIILFGSAARGQTGRGSDIDVLVVAPEGSHRRKTAQAIYRALLGFGLPVDVVVATPSDVENYRESPGLIYRGALREGRELYAA
jgi:predicted nucleotidyltransferase